MKDELSFRSTEFNNRAGKALLAVYGEFMLSARSVDRLREENVFQLLQGRYLARLKHRLQSIATEILSGMEPGSNRNELNQVLTRSCEDHLKEFTGRIRSL